MANNTLASLEAQLDRAVDAAVAAQAAVDAARRRVGLSKAPKAFFTAAEMIAELCAAHDRHDAEARIELREITKATIADCRLRWLRGYVPTPLETAMMGWPSAFKALEAGKQAQAAEPKARSDNVVSLAQQIAAAGKKRRGEA
jgi:hypothetical protein